MLTQREHRGDPEARREPPVERQRAVHLPVVVRELVVDPLLEVDALELLDRHGSRVADERVCRMYSERVRPRTPARSRSCSSGAARGSPQVASAERQNSAASRQRTQL